MRLIHLALMVKVINLAAPHHNRVDPFPTSYRGQRFPVSSPAWIGSGSRASTFKTVNMFHQGGGDVPERLSRWGIRMTQDVWLAGI